ncbi:MAG: hypothetical protein GX259_07640 [Bacteroidales bacterium]|nr:hypothetical protein [Bacteroidales bacterium]
MKHIILVFVIAIIAVACGEAKVVDLKLCNQVTEKECNYDSSRFYAVETDTLYLTGRLKNVPSKTKISIKWYYFEENAERQEIAGTDFVTDDGSSKKIYALLYPPKSGWPIGKYSVEVMLSVKDSKKSIKRFTME